MFPAPNPSLKPEHMWNYQANLQLRPHSDFSARITGYYADLDNQIVTTGRFPNIELQNGGRSLNRGLEAKAQWRPWYRPQFDAGYAYLRSTKLAPQVPGHKLNYSLNLNLTKVSVYLGGVTVGRRWTSSARDAGLDPYTLVKVKGTIPIAPKTQLFVTLDNLFNTDYEVVPGYPMPGTNFMAGLSCEF
jgi:outer membrane receptor protein involved in Fe transport